MTADPELRQYLEIVRSVLSDRAATTEDLDSDQAMTAFRTALGPASVLNLAREAAAMANSLSWLTATISAIAAVAPSVAFSVAAHYTACRAVSATVGSSDGEPTGTAGLLTGEAVAVVPTVLEPVVVLLLDGRSRASVLAPSVGFEYALDDRSFSGLRGARLREVRLTGNDMGHRLDPDTDARAVRDWHVLCAAVSLGIADGCLRSAEQYAAERRQFGSALNSFAAMRAMLADMRLRLDSVRALLDRAVQSDAGDLAWAVTAAAGRGAVSIALDAIQVHGGYGYIEEYPVARQLRDAISVSARSCARRAALAHVAADRLGAAEWEVRA
jgi:alkylation response protein AidB-like acyl-CoA dehydrogenase